MRILRQSRVKRERKFKHDEQSQIRVRQYLSRINEAQVESRRYGSRSRTKPVRLLFKCSSQPSTIGQKVGLFRRQLACYAI